jgi:hypothetical protein
MQNCLHCDLPFKDKKRLRKHRNKCHRDAHALTEVEETDIETVSSKHVVPSTVFDIEVLAGFPAESSPPSGFAPSDLPLLKVRYRRKKGLNQVLQWEEPQIVCYHDIRNRFPKCLCEYLTSRVVLVKPGND